MHTSASATWNGAKASAATDCWGPLGLASEASGRLTNAGPKSNLCPLIRLSRNATTSPWRGRSRGALLRLAANRSETDNLFVIKVCLLLLWRLGRLVLLYPDRHTPNPIQQDRSSFSFAFAPYKYSCLWSCTCVAAHLFKLSVKHEL